MSSAPTRAWRSLGARFAVLYVLVSLVAFAAAAVVLAVRTNAWVKDEGDRSATAALDRARRALDEGGVEGLRRAVVESGGPSMDVRVLDERSVEIVAVATDSQAERAGAAMRGAPGTTPRPPADWHVARGLIASGREIRVVVHDDQAARVWSRAKGDVVIIAAVGLLAVVLGAFVLSAHALRPIDDLARASARIVRSGDLGLRVSERHASGALGELAVLFNQMLARNERLVRGMKESLDDVAHDLRTPLTRLRAGAELALEAPAQRSPEEALADVVDETDRVLAMLAALMDIAEAETGVMRLTRKEAALADVAREAIDLYELVAQERGVHVVTKLSCPARAEVDRRRVLQVIANLLDNAIKYTPPGGRVELETFEEERFSGVTVTDTGVGIAAEDQPRVWDRLFRGDRSRTERGLGLGLSLVKAVVEAHGGQVLLKSAEGAGTRIEARFPRATNAA